MIKGIVTLEEKLKHKKIKICGHTVEVDVYLYASGIPLRALKHHHQGRLNGVNNKFNS